LEWVGMQRVGKKIARVKLEFGKKRRWLPPTIIQ
jgi:hypothetical protein